MKFEPVLNKLANGWLLQAALLLVLLIRIDAMAWLREWVLWIGVLLYAPLLIRKSIERARSFRPPTTKVFALFLLLTIAMLAIHSVGGLLGWSFLPTGAFHLLAAFTLIVDISEHTFLKFYQNMHPALAFVITFFGIIIFGSALLMLPAATVRGIAFIDALFTATSAVCVTGLAVLDTGKDFTFLGQVIILFLIQAGGIGILTFTNLFGLLFRGEKSFKDIIFLTDLISAGNLRTTFRNLVKIIVFVFGVEAAGALMIYLASPQTDLFFAIFHAVSAFCNAGFSTLTNSLYEPDFRFNYALQLIIAWLIITGGIGYNVFFNVFSVFRFRLRKFLSQYISWVEKPSSLLVKWDINTTLVWRTTLILLAGGWALFYVLEYHNTLAEHGTWGKIAGAFFGSVTPRTAGFNAVDMTALLHPTIMVYLLLMWVGASPGSTGGGIKTTVFALATLNLINQVRGRDQLVFKWQTVPASVIARVTTVISLSLIALGLGTTLIISLQPELPVLSVAFECFSAYATVGLSIGLTAKLCTASKVIVIILMFLGRVSFLTFLIALLATINKRSGAGRMIFPENNIIVN
ncbi:MAG: ATPase [Saprospirales bacterium]|nr:ATPase [Saprospirales bacterium]